MLIRLYIEKLIFKLIWKICVYIFMISTKIRNKSGKYMTHYWWKVRKIKIEMRNSDEH